METFKDVLYVESDGLHINSSVQAFPWTEELVYHICPVPHGVESKKHYIYRIEIENHISPFITKDSVKELVCVLKKAIAKAENICHMRTESRKPWVTKCKHSCALILVLTNGTIDISYNGFKHHWHLNKSCVQEVVDTLEAVLDVTK